MSKATRKITNFNFESEGAHVALVDKAANKQEVLVMKSEKASEEEIQKAVHVNIKLPLLEFLTRYMYMNIDEAETIAGMLGYSFEDLYEEGEMSGFQEMVEANLNKVTVSKSESAQKFVGAFEEFKQKYLTKASSSVEDGESVSKSTEENTTKSKEDIIQMSEENKVTQEQLEEQINKAAESIVAKRLEELEKSYEDKVNAATKEVELLKAREEAREKQEYLSKAEAYAKYLGEEADKEAIAKALSAVEKSEDAKAILDVLKALKDTVEKDDDKLFEEVGKSTTQDQPSDMESKVEAIQKSLMKEKGLTEHAAYVEAFDQVRAEQA